ncbi:hypothetical protein LINGRAHAP2_LOCUS16081 [Linum grandiflorum]
MGNQHGRNAAVQPLNYQGGDGEEEERAAITELLSPAPRSGTTPSGVRIRVGMTMGQLHELMTQIPKSKFRGNKKKCSSSELGRLILRECLKGRFRARVVGVLPPFSTHED